MYSNTEADVGFYHFIKGEGGGGGAEGGVTVGVWIGQHQESITTISTSRGGRGGALQPPQPPSPGSSPAIFLHYVNNEQRRNRRER